MISRIECPYCKASLDVTTALVVTLANTNQSTRAHRVSETTPYSVGLGLCARVNSAIFFHQTTLWGIKRPDSWQDKSDFATVRQVLELVFRRPADLRRLYGVGKVSFAQAKSECEHWLEEHPEDKEGL